MNHPTNHPKTKKQKVTAVARAGGRPHLPGAARHSARAFDPEERDPLADAYDDLESLGGETSLPPDEDEQRHDYRVRVPLTKR